MCAVIMCGIICSVDTRRRRSARCIFRAATSNNAETRARAKKIITWEGFAEIQRPMDCLAAAIALLANYSAVESTVASLVPMHFRTIGAPDSGSKIARDSPFDRAPRGKSSRRLARRSALTQTADREIENYGDMFEK